MERVRAALKRAGIEDRDIQTSSINLNPEYRYDQNRPPRLTGYRASNTVNVKFRDLKRTGAILDALVAEGANQINGPSLTIDKPEVGARRGADQGDRHRPGAGRPLRPGARHAGGSADFGQRGRRLRRAAADADGR